MDLIKFNDDDIWNKPLHIKQNTYVRFTDYEKLMIEYEILQKDYNVLKEHSLNLYKKIKK